MTEIERATNAMMLAIHVNETMKYLQFIRKTEGKFMKPSYRVALNNLETVVNRVYSLISEPLDKEWHDNNSAILDDITRLLIKHPNRAEYILNKIEIEVNNLEKI